jgi:hypothetical protein
MTLQVRDYALGAQGLAQGLQAVGELVAAGMRAPQIFTWARRAMWEAGLPVNASPPSIAQAIYKKQRADMVFAQDPYGTELMMSAVKLLCLDPAGECIRGGDCDDNVIVLASALMSVGIPVRLIIRRYPKMQFLHLMIEYDADPKKGGAWTCFDATSPDGSCFAGYSAEVVASLEVGPMVVEQQPAQLLILGQPPLMGAPPAAAATSAMSAEQTAVWVQAIAQAKADLDRSIRGLLFATGQLDAVRSDLGMPQADAATGPEAAGASPVQDYAHNYLWTTAAQSAQAKLVQSAMFASGVLGDALSGARLLYWKDGDVFVGALDGDPYGILMKPGPGGGLVPDYVDLSTGASTGQVGFGIAPLIIGAIAVVVLSIAASFAVTKICDYLAGAHRDDAMNKVAAAQQALVAGGQQTPEQAQAFMRAATDMASAPGPTTPRGMGVAEILAAAAVGLVLGIAGAVAAPHLAPHLSIGSPAPA